MSPHCNGSFGVRRMPQKLKKTITDVSPALPMFTETEGLDNDDE